MTAQVAASAVVEDGAEIGERTVVWDLAQVRSGARVGTGCVLGRNVFVDAGVVIGDRCKIQNNALLYAPARLGDGVFIGPAAVLTNDRRPRAVGPAGDALTTGGWQADPVVVEEGASVGAGAVLVAGVTIGGWALIGAGAVVTRDVLPYALVIGNPARRIAWVGRGGARLIQADERGSMLRCPDTGALFRDHGDQVEPA